MKIKKTILTFIEVTEGKRYLELAFKDNDLEYYDSNLPYEKDLDDWKFYGKAISKIVKSLK